MTAALHRQAYSLHEYGATANEAIFAAKFEVNGFASSFHHCEQIADYVAQFVTSNYYEPERLGTMVSMCLNEVLEAAFRHHRGRDALWIEVRQLRAEDEGDGPLVVVISIPADGAVIAVYEQCRARIEDRYALDSYRELLRNGFADSSDIIGLVELATVYDIDLSIHTEPSAERVTITMKIDHTLLFREPP